MKTSAKVSLSETTKKHETIDAFGFDDPSSLTFQKLRVTVFGGGNEIINATTTTTTMLPKVYLSLCPMDENANVENEASMSDANGARCEVSVAKLDETKACQFVAFAGADIAYDKSEGQRKRRRRRRRSAANVPTTRRRVRKRIRADANRSEQKENVRYRLFTCG